MRIIRGKYGRRRFEPPKNITARPTTDFARENLFNVRENMDEVEDKTVLDLFGGTGAISFEFISRGAQSVTIVEQDRPQTGFIRSVKEKLGEENLHLICGDVFRYITAAPKAFDVIFADPPYDHPRFDEIPQLILNSRLVKPGSLVIIEHSGKKDFSQLPGFFQRREYGSVNFSMFRVS